MASSKFIKGAALCGIGAAVSFIPAGMATASATTAKVTAKVTKKVTKKVHAKPVAKKSGTFLGKSAQTIYGAVQVSVTLKNGKITHVNSPVYPVGTFRDQQINSVAIPMLEQEVLQAQSSNINNISGASYTAQGFYNSLVTALAKAGLK